MADWNVGLADPQASGARPVAPVQQQGIGGILKDVADIGESLFKGKLKADKDNAEQAKQAILRDYSERYTAITDSESSGSLMPGQRKAMSQSLFNQYVAKNPELVDEFKKLTTGFRELGNISEDIDVIKSDQEHRKALLADMQKSGIVIYPSMSKATQDSMIDAYQEQRRIDADLEKRIKANQELRAQLGEERSAYAFETKQQAAKGLISIGSSHLTAAQSFTSDLIARAKGGADPEGLKIEMMQYFSNIDGAINAIAVEAPELAGAWKSMFSDVRKVAELGIDNKQTAEQLENQLKIVKNKAQLAALSDSSMQALYATSALLNGNLPSTFYEANAAARDTLIRISGGVDKSASVVGDGGKELAANGIISNTVKQLKDGTHQQPDLAKTQVGNIANQVLKDVYKLSFDDAVSAKQLNNVSNLLASPEWAYMVENKIVNRELNMKAKQAFQMLYEKEVSTKIGERLLSPSRLSAEMPVYDLVDIKWNGSGVSFDIKNKGGKDMQDRQIHQLYVKEMNTNSIALNKLIHIGAHMEGHTDYSKYWETNKHLLLPSLYAEKGYKKDGWEYVGPGYATYKENWKKIEGDK